MIRQLRHITLTLVTLMTGLGLKAQVAVAPAGNQKGAKSSRDENKFSITLIEEGLLFPTKVYPIPASATLIIESETEGLDIVVMDAKGQFVLARKTGAGKHREELSVSGLAKGEYFINLIGKDRQRMNVYRLVIEG